VAEAAIASLGKIGDEAAWEAIASLRKTAAPDRAPALTEASVRCAAGLAASGNHKTAIAAYQELLCPLSAGLHPPRSLEALLRLDKDRGEERILRAIRGSDSALKTGCHCRVRSLRSKQPRKGSPPSCPACNPRSRFG